MIELSGVSKTYAKSDRKAIDSLSLTVQNGRIFGFLGPNGAGKTTTIRVFCGALEPDEGSVLIDGVSMAEHPLDAKRRIGLVHDNPELFNRLKAIEYLNFIGDVFRISSQERRTRIDEYAARFGLSDVLSASIGSFSRGMKQKLGLIASLIHDPANWVLDEPMVGLDPQSAFELKELMRQRTREGKCVFFSTHVMEVAEKVCNELAIIDKGKIIFKGTIEDLRRRKESTKPGVSGEAGAGVERERGGEEDSLERLFLELVDSSREGEGL
jgi:ABC-2 type transport system ATP-binding protein